MDDTPRRIDMIVKNFAVKIIVFLAVYLVACQSAPDLLEPTSVPIPSQTPTATAASVTPAPTWQAPSPTPSLVPSLLPTMTPVVDFDETALVAAFSLDELSEWLATNWQEGRTPDEVQAVLEDTGWIARAEELRERFFMLQTISTFVAADLNGDGSEEWIIALITGDSNCGPENNISRFWVISGGDVVFELLPPAEERSWADSGIIAMDDLTGDGLPEVVLQSIYCTAHTPFATYHLLSAHHGRIENVLKKDEKLENLPDIKRSLSGDDPGSEWSVPGVSLSNAHVQITVMDDRSLPALILSGGTYNSAGAGYVRPRHEIWAWDGQQIMLAAVEWEDTNQQIHLLYTANFTFALGEFEQAQEMYRRVIQEDFPDDLVLLGWSPIFAEEAIEINQFAAFRLILTSLLLEDAAEAHTWLQWIRTQYPETPLTLASIYLVENWSLAESLPLLCSEISDLLLEFENPTGPLEETGYGNPRLTANDVCAVPQKP